MVKHEKAPHTTTVSTALTGHITHVTKWFIIWNTCATAHSQALYLALAHYMRMMILDRIVNEARYMQLYVCIYIYILQMWDTIVFHFTQLERVQKCKSPFQKYTYDTFN